MKIKKGQRSVKLPPIGSIVTVTWAVDEDIPESTTNEYSVWMVTPQDIEQRISSKDTPESPIEGMIAYACLIGNELIFYPRPDRNGNLRLRYFPPMEEI